MKHFTYNFLSLLFIPLVMTGQTTKKVSLEFDKKDFSFKYDDSGKLYITSDVQSLTYKSAPQEPALPIVRISLLIGENESFENVQVNLEEDLVMTDVLLAPNPQVVETDYYQEHYKDTTTVTYRESIYPSQDIQFTGTHFFRGYKYLSFLVSPFKYDALKKKLYLRTSMSFSLNMSKNIRGMIPESNSTYVARDVPTLSCLKRLIINYDQLEELYGAKSNSSLTQGSTYGYEYLIITNNALKDSFQDLANWKTTKGIKSKIITTEFIASHYTGNSLQVKIKKAIKDYYNGTYSGLRYVLLGGDVDVVPSRMCHIGFVKNDSVYKEETTPVDLFFACFDRDFEWDANGNGVYGEIDDNVDLLPEVIVTRIPVNTTGQAASYVNRVINYERLPKTEDWKNSILMGGHYLWRYYADKIDSEVKADSFFTKYVQPYWKCERVKLFDTIEGDSSSIFNRDTLQCKLENGHTFCDIITHGNKTQWRTQFYYPYNTGYAQNMENTGNTIITTIACLTNAFDYPVCLSEAFIRNANSGVLGYLGCSRESLSSIWPTMLGGTFDYNGEFYKNLFTVSDGVFGRAISDAKALFAPICLNDSTAYRWVMFTLNPIGDPELNVFLDNPRNFTNVQISISDGTINVTTGESDTKICVSSMADSCLSYFQVYDSSQASFSNITDDVYVCITKPGYIPYIAVCGESIYIQDKVITGDYNVVAGSVLAGSNVTTHTPQGPVVIHSGNVNMHGINGVTLKNDFEVQAGASLSITTGH